jgi:hypothetical protein
MTALRNVFRLCIRRRRKMIESTKKPQTARETEPIRRPTPPFESGSPAEEEVAYETSIRELDKIT